jgi:hypothetical protein
MVQLWEYHDCIHVTQMGHSYWNEGAHGVTEMVDAANIDDDDNVKVTLLEDGRTKMYVLVTVLPFPTLYNFFVACTILLWYTKYEINFQLERWLIQCTIYLTCTLRFFLM